MTYYVLRLFSFVGIVRDIRPVPAAVRDEARALGAERLNPCARADLVSPGMTKRRLTALVLVAIGVAALAGCGSKSSSPSTGSPAGDPGARRRSTPATSVGWRRERLLTPTADR